MSVLTMVLSALGGGGVLAWLVRLVVQLVPEHRLSLVTKKCLEAKTKVERDYYHSLLRTLKESGDQELGIEVQPKAPRQRQRRATKALASAAQSEPETSN
ncbi:MAG TPA: hypothetical protein VGB74_07865 [Actinoplanes sp.]